MNDFRRLVQQSNDRVIFQNKPHSDKTEFEFRKEKQFPEKSVNLSKKQKLPRTDSNLNLINLQDEAARNNTRLSENPNCSQQLALSNLNMQTSLCNANSFEKDVLEKNNDM